MPGSRRVLKILTGCVWGASVATVLLSVYAAITTGYRYEPLTSFRTYDGILVGSAFVLAIVILAGLITVHRIDGASHQIISSMREVLRSVSGWGVPASQVPEGVETVLKQTPNTPEADWLRESIDEYRNLQQLRKDIKTLMAAPVGLLSAIFAISAWALPATSFLQHFYQLNTTLLYVVTYGTVVAVASAVAAALVMLSTKVAASA